MKLLKWAKLQDISNPTAYRWFHAGQIPNSRQLASGTIIVDEPVIKNANCEKIVIYCRVSSHNKKDDLIRQSERCEEFCLARGYSVDKVYKEIASGMNDNRKLFWKMMETNPTKIIVEHKDRLTRFGFNYIEKLLQNKCEIIVINRDKENEIDLIKDMTSIVTSFCCRMYGLRRGNNKLKKIKEVINDPVN